MRPSLTKPSQSNVRRSSLFSAVCNALSSYSTGVACSAAVARVGRIEHAHFEVSSAFCIRFFDLRVHGFDNEIKVFHAVSLCS